ncbi:hypothetical protein HYU50_03910 [Candidatus Woesearchaeota archaeon]|nr:hypothetical protein [Candidatus Woesearchaeota archaeon]
MVKIKALSILIGLVLAVFLAPNVFAQEENFGVCVTGCKLFITDVDVKVGSKTDKNLQDGESISDEAAPGDTVQFSIKVYNNFTDDDDVEIEDVTITVTIEGIDDDDDLEEETNEFDIKADSDEKETLEFEIPLEVDEDTFNVLIEVEGDSDNGSQEVKMELDLEVQKEDDEVRFLRNSLAPSEVQCGRSVQLSTSVINTGSNEQEDSVLEVSNADLGVSFKETFDLSDDPFDDDSKFSKTFAFTVPEDVPAGVYPITTKVTFDDGKETETETADLVVATCEALEEEVKEEEATEEEVVVVQPTVQPTVPTGGVIAQPVTAPSLPATEEKSLFQSTGFLAALVAGEVLLVIIAIVIVVAVVRKRS